MEENKVVLKLEEYMDLIKEVQYIETQLEEKDKNYICMISYIKNEVKKEQQYHIKNCDIKPESKFTDKISDYHYKNLVDSFLEKGITFDLAMELTDNIIQEYQKDQEAE